MEPNSPSENQKKPNLIQVNKIIWAALLFSQLQMILVSYYIFKGDLFSFMDKEITMGENFADRLLIIFSGISFILCLLSEFLPPFFKHMVKVDNERNLLENDIAKKSFTPLVIKWSLLDSVVILGIVCSFLIEQNFTVAFAIAPILLMLKSFPTLSYMKKIISLS